MDVHDDHGAVVGAKLPQARGDLLGVAVARFAVGDVQDRWRIALGVGVAPSRDLLGCLGESRAHGRSGLHPQVRLQPQ